MASEFKDKVAIITGAGRGIGRAHALALGRLGAKVVVNDFGGSLEGTGGGNAADDVVAEIIAAGGTAIANHGSVSSREDSAQMVQDAVNAFGTVHILVNNAGILRDMTFRKMTLDDFDEVVKVHLTGTAYVTHAAWPIMYEQRYGRIVFTSSGSGIFGNFGQGNYGAAKMGMVGLMNVLTQEGSRRNVNVNCLAPSAVTRMTASVKGRDVDADNPPPERDPSKVTPAVLFMCSEDAPSGKIIQAGGGRFASIGVYSNKAVDFGAEADYEKFLAAKDLILDMSTAKEGNQNRLVQPMKADAPKR
jgi:NAD(P)-dependent dehydrogenase (short-subunit alcohol dehydrogenase family)